MFALLDGFGIPNAAKHPRRRKPVERFEDRCLALSILTSEDREARRNIQLEVFKIPEVRQSQMLGGKAQSTPLFLKNPFSLERLLFLLRVGIRGISSFSGRLLRFNVTTG